MLLKDNELFKMINARFPQAGKRIFALWGRPEAIMYLNDLIVDAKEDPASGYSSEIEAAFQQLKKTHDEDFPRQEGQPEWHALTFDEDFLRVNTKFKRIGRRLKELWGGPEFGAYINDLIHDTRDGARQGFPPDVAMGMFKLSQKHDKVFPQYMVKNTDLWGGI
ncbi:MAG: hypothetical protein PHY45_07560 [Rhodocyclaceae bacterium]|nr:hypothetical protein [Rhodocyclaceae bacterium]